MGKLQEGTRKDACSSRPRQRMTTNALERQSQTAPAPLKYVNECPTCIPTRLKRLSKPSEAYQSSQKRSAVNLEWSGRAYQSEIVANSRFPLDLEPIRKFRNSVSVPRARATLKLVKLRRRQTGFDRPTGAVTFK